MTWAKRLFIGATSVLVVLAAVPGFLLGTETGLQIIKGALEKAVPGLRIESLSGSVFSLKADNLQYDVPGLAFHGNLSWDLSVAKLLSRRERRKWRRRLQRLSRNRLLKSLTKLRPRGLKHRLP